MFMRRLKTSGSNNFCREAFVIYRGLNVSLMSCGTEICTIKNGELTMKCMEGELSAADKRHLKIFCKRFKHRLS